MPYETELQRHLDIFALSLSLKKNNRWSPEDDKVNYPLLFSIYIKMIQQDEQEFFVRKQDKLKMIQSLNRSKDFYSFTRHTQLFHTLKRMISNDPRDFILLPLSYSIKKNKKSGHVSGALIYKETKNYRIILVDKRKHLSNSSVNMVKIPSEKMAPLCKELFAQRDHPKLETCYDILYRIIDHSSSNSFSSLDYTMHEQKEGNCVVKEIEATAKTALLHCRHNLLASQGKKKLKWSDVPESTLEMQKRFLTVIKSKYIKSPLPDYFFEIYKLRKRANDEHSPLTMTEKNRIHEIYKKIFADHPEIQEIFKETPSSNLSKVEKPIQLNKAIIADPKMGKYPKAGNTKNMINIFEKITDEKNRIANGLKTEKRTPKDEFIR
ncbi:hypothetical protein [Enterococcus hirae]|uniref:hypothetical protein n=1 Tax=Enterococcus hirae TaxID=1354 RepID=UPI0009BD0220|nr:hypothetical protein [Enterococcus hirae]EMF0308578.1 hypothetical protein [Enterococcus hirae]OQO34948.1 hypothetical protein BH731_05255 [Enterococcus hirae]OQO37705.1 hypothetical protein BH738_08245 [Enterococcus hirae]OQO52807.1 hypothetical protein BH736_09160 [Enterococcus hirae]QQU12019.1 hypothetical protein I6I81_06920 [Enterococcus hirae]